MPFNQHAISMPKPVSILLCLWAVMQFPAEAVGKNCLPSALYPESEVFLTRGEGVVTQLDMDAYLQTIPEHHRAEFLKDPNRIADVANNLVTKRQLMAAACADASIDADNPLLRARLHDQAAEIISNRYLRRRWQEARLNDYSQRAREIYLGNPELFRTRGTLDITIAFIRAGDLSSEPDAMRRILEVHEAAQEGEFADLARSVSDHSGTSDPQVSFKNVQRESLDSTVAGMVARLSVGEISPPFRAARGWYIVKLDDVNPGEIPDFEAVEEEAAKIAEQRHKESFEERLLREVNSEQVSIAEGAVENLLSRYQQTESDLKRLNQDVRGLMTGG